MAMAEQYDENQLSEAAAIFHALSDPARLRTIVLLASAPQSVSELAAATAERIGTVSARLVKRRRQGQSAVYSIADDHVFRLIANALEHADEATHT